VDSDTLLPCPTTGLSGTPTALAVNKDWLDSR
jgi:hypothetical protein